MINSKKKFTIYQQQPKANETKIKAAIDYLASRISI